ncbi:hypothetical protein ScPMuIL_015245 [Solemya velum]
MGEADDRKGKDGTPTRVQFHISPTRDDPNQEGVFDFSKLSLAARDSSDHTWPPKTCASNVEGTMGTGEIGDFSRHPILHFIRDNIIGGDMVVEGPYGRRQVIYCDYTASGRSLSFIEDYIRDFVYPFYGNTHTTTSITSKQTTAFREQSKEIIRRCVNASDDDVVIFTGSGTTGAIHKLAWGLDLHRPDVARNTVVLIGPYEHHSNILPWKELGTTIVRIKQTKHGQVDLVHMEEELQKHRDENRFLIAALSAASNVTGIITDTDKVTELVHKYGGLSVWDYATAAAYLKIDMNTSEKSYKDAVFLSPHKFVGGPGTPGLLIAKKSVFRNPVPDHCGGGTVLFVTRETHLYLKDIESREEGGTPAIIESIRAGLVFQLKEAVSTDLIDVREEVLCQKAYEVWSQNKNIIILGSRSARRLPIFSFIIQHPESGKFLHHNFIATLLNDLYGIQARGGCACAGPYAEDLLGISEPLAQKFVWFLVDHSDNNNGESCKMASLEIMKPGFTRLNLPYFFDDDTIDYVIAAVDIVAQHGWKLLPQYTFDPEKGSWWHTKFSEMGTCEMLSLHDLKYSEHGFINSRRPPPTSLHLDLEAMLDESDRAIQFSEAGDGVLSVGPDSLDNLIPADRQSLKWFLTPREAYEHLTGGIFRSLEDHKKTRTPFRPHRNFSSQFSHDSSCSSTSDIS